MVEWDLTLGDGHMMLSAGDGVLSCILDTCMVLLTNVTPNKFNFRKCKKKVKWGNDKKSISEEATQ